MKSFCDKFFYYLNLIIDSVAVISFLGTFLLVIINVIGRYVAYLGSLSWSEEGARYLFISTCCFGLIQVTRKRGHFSVTMLVEALPPLIQRICSLIVNIFVIALAAVLIHGSLLMAELTVNNRSSALGLPTCVLYYLMAFSAFGIVMCTLKNMLEDRRTPAETQPNEE